MVNFIALGSCKSLQNRDFLEERKAQSLQIRMEASLQLETLFDDSDQHIHGLIEFDAEGLLSVEGARHLDQTPGEVGVDFPVSDLIGMGQGIARDLTADAHGLELGWLGSQTRFDVSETVAIGQLGKGHGEKLIPARKALDFLVALVRLYATAKFVRGIKVHQLGDYRFAKVHPSPPPEKVRKYGSG